MRVSTLSNSSRPGPRGSVIGSVNSAGAYPFACRFFPGGEGEASSSRVRCLAATFAALPRKHRWRRRRSPWSAGQPAAARLLLHRKRSFLCRRSRLSGLIANLIILSDKTIIRKADHRSTAGEPRTARKKRSRKRQEKDNDSSDRYTLEITRSALAPTVRRGTPGEWAQKPMRNIVR